MSAEEKRCAWVGTCHGTSGPCPGTPGVEACYEAPQAVSAPVLFAEELAAIEARAASIAKYHKEHASYGGIGRDFHAYAETLLGADVPRLLAALAHMTKVAEAERALRRAGKNWRRAQGRHIEAMTLRLPDEEQRGAESAQATRDLLAADRALRALGVEP